MCSSVDLKLYVDSDFASRDSNRRSLSEKVVMCAGACGSLFFFLGRRRVSLFLLLSEAGYVAMAARIKEKVFFCGISGVLYFRAATLGAL